MREIPVHFWAILAAAVVRMAIGALWYSPALFRRSWMELSGISEEQMREGLPKALAVDFVGSFLMAFVLVHAIRYAGADAVPQGMAVGFLNWLGFVAVVTINGVTYERRPFKLFIINNGYLLVSLLVMGAVLALWG